MGQSLRFGKYTTDLSNASSIFKTFASDCDKPKRVAERIPIDRHYFDELLRREHMSLRGLARRIGMSHSQLSLAFSGNRKLTLDEAAQISFIFSEPMHRITQHAGVSRCHVA